MNSAGLVMATKTVTLMMPSKMSSGVMVSPNPTKTPKASPGLAPARPPRFQIPVRKFWMVLLTVTQVLALLFSKPA